MLEHELVSSGETMSQPVMTVTRQVFALTEWLEGIRDFTVSGGEMRDLMGEVTGRRVREI